MNKELRLIDGLFDEIMTLTEVSRAEMAKAHEENNNYAAHRKYGEGEGLFKVIDILLTKKNEILEQKEKQ